IEFQEKEHQVWLTERGAVHAERLLGVNNLYELENAHYLEMIHTFLEARLLYKKDRDYIVKNGTVFVIEHTTGRVAEGRRFPDHLHLAIEIKEGVKARKGSQIYNMMPLQFYLLKYRRLCGMTGTAW
ncbi:preprotein translocase subunit SecA, partial [Intestinibacillus massiliensis]|nr:preprotein translocase subunit SecA [Intestinibacillus massiliensis]